MTPAVDKLNGRGLSNTAHRERECLLKKTMVTQYWQVATEGLPGCANTLERFNDRGE